MTNFDDRTELETQFNTAWAGETKIIWENTQRAVEGLTEYVEFFLVRGDETIFLNSGGERVGFVQLIIWAQRGDNTVRLEELGDLAVTALQNKELSGVTTYEAQRFRAPDLPRRQRDWHRMIIRVPYRHTET